MYGDAWRTDRHQRFGMFHSEGSGRIPVRIHSGEEQLCLGMEVFSKRRLPCIRLNSLRESPSVG